MKEYLKKHNFEKKIEKLSKKLEGKSVVIYGSGLMFQEILASYDVSKLNVIGITDRKYLLEDEDRLDLGFKIIPYSKIFDIKSDVILIAVKCYKPILNMLKKIHPNREIIPLVPIKNDFDLTAFFSKFSFFKNKKMDKSNKIVLIKANGKKVYNPKIKNLVLKFSGKNNYLEIREPFIIEEKVIIQATSDNKIIIGANNEHRYTKIIMGSKNTLEIGANVTTVGLAIHMHSAQNRTIHIGDDCQFSWTVMVRSADAHTVYDAKTKKILNEGKNVYIGNHVWIAQGVTILKGSYIAANSMVGVGSIVNKEFKEENSMIVGVPAKVVKTGINWDRRGVAEFAR